MAFFAFLPLGLLGGIVVTVCAVWLAVEISERRRQLHARPRRRRFRPVVIQGGRLDMVESAVVETPAGDKLAG